MNNKSLNDIREILHDLWKSLPAVKTRYSQEVVARHMALIAYYQSQYDRLHRQLADSAAPQPA